MHAVAAVFASIVTFVSGFFAPTVASNSPVDVRTTQPAAAAVAQAEIEGNPFTDPAAASAVAAAATAAPAPAFSPPPAQTVVNQPVIERIIERVVPQGDSRISADTLAAILADFGQSIENRIAALNPPKADIPPQIAASGNAGSAGFFPASQRIDQLSNTAINTPTITGGAISGASISGYLPTSGGTLSGALSAGTLALSGTLTGTDASFSGTLSAGTLNVAGVSSGGAITGPYFTATSTTATSSFAGGLTAANGSFSILQNGNVGIGTASPSRALHVYDSVNSYILVQGGNLGGLLLQGTTTSSGMPAYGNINTYTDGSLRIQASSAGWVAAATQLTLATSGNLGIGTTTPWGKLSVTGSGTGTGLAFAVADSANTPRFVIQDNGNVGIGTTSPSARLDVGGYGAYDLGYTPNNAIRLIDNYNGISDISIKNINTNINAASAFQAFDSGGSYVSLAMPGIGNTAAPLFGLARASTTYLFSNTVGVNPARNLAIGTLGANSLTLGTNNTARATIDSSGNVGIGTTSPTNKFEVAGNTFLGGSIVGTSTLALTGTSGTTTIAAGQGFTIGSSQFVLQAATGNVGIGLSSPTDKLHVFKSVAIDTPAAGIILSRYHASESDMRAAGIFNYFGTGAGEVLAFGLSQGGTPNTIANTKMVVTSNGLVGIGTTTPWGKLSIKGSGTGTGLAFAVADSANTPRFVIQDNGNVGIGTTSPISKLNIASGDDENASLGIAQLALSYVSGGYSHFIKTTHSGGLQEKNRIIFAVGNGASNSTPTSNVTDVMTLTGTGNVGIGTTTPWGKLSITGSGTGTGLGFVFADSANTPRFVIQDNGNIGIGTTSPAAKLEVSSSGSGNPVSFYMDGDRGLLNAQAGNIGFRNKSTNIASIDGYTGATGGSINYGQLVFSTANSGSLIERMRITESGNVGIGTTSPFRKFEVAGSSGESSGGPIMALYATNGFTNARRFSIQNGVDATSNYLGFNVENDAGAVASTPLTIRTSGNVGIGTTTPWGKLSITGSGTGTGLAFAVADSANTPRFVIQDNGNVGIGTTSPNAKLQVFGTSADITADVPLASGASIVRVVSSNTVALDFGSQSSSPFGMWLQARDRSSGGLNYPLLLNPNGGNVGIGTTTPTAQLSTTGTVRFAGLSSGGANLITDALGNVTAASDERLKDKQGDFTRGLAAVNAISPVLYKWRPETGFDTQSTYAGFFAQNVQATIPEAVSQDSRGYLTLADRPILAALVNAVKEISQRFTDLAERVVTKEIVATNGQFDRLCVGSTCVTEEQFMAMVAAAGQSAVSPSPAVPSTASEAPVIEINGNATSTLEIGDTYNDLGARIIAPESDLNLGLVILLDGATTSAVSIDTTTPGEHTIIYTVTSPTTGLTGSTMRTVIVSPAEQSPVPAEEDANPFTAPDNDNASSTTAVDVAA